MIRERIWEFLQDFLIICLALTILLGTYFAGFSAAKKQMEEDEEDRLEFVLRIKQDTLGPWEVGENGSSSRMSFVPQKAIR
jgi:hypothetical protein